MTSFQVLGDPHLGRRFSTGVPLHRAGDREAMVWTDFEKSLMGATTEVHVCMGDLFDKFVVAPEVVLRAAETYEDAAAAHPGTTFVVLMGNHDPSKDTTKRSSFDIFEKLVAGVSNIKVIRSPEVINELGFIPYSVFGSAKASLAALLMLAPKEPLIVFGHFDVVDWGGDNVVPTAELAEAGFFEVFTGHDHLARVEKRHGVTIRVTGSMQPYTHAEDADGLFYKTVTLDDLVTMDTTNLNIRVLLQPGEVLPEDIDCLSLTAKKLQGSLEDVAVDTEEFDSFDLEGELSNLLPESIRAEVMEVFHQ